MLVIPFFTYFLNLKKTESSNSLKENIETFKNVDN